MNLSPEFIALRRIFFVALRIDAMRSFPMDPEASTSTTRSFGTIWRFFRGESITRKYVQPPEVSAATAMFTNFDSSAAFSEATSIFTAAFSASTAFSSTFS